jgi:hypothetical protein
VASPQLIVPLSDIPGIPKTATHVRGTLLAGSRQALRSTEQKQRYDSVLDPAYADAMLNLVVASWVPMEVARAHYEAMEAMGYTYEEQRENGRMVAQRIQNSFVGTIIRGLKASGSLSVWPLLERVEMAYVRLAQGGGTQLYKLGPKDARVEFHGLPLLDIPYIRAGLEGMIESTLGLVTRKVYASQVTELQTETTLAITVSWV